MSAKKLNVTRVPLDTFVEDPENARLHTPRNLEAIGGSVKRYGLARSVVSDGDDVIRAGSGTLKKAKESGIKTAIVVETDGSELVVVKRRDWTDDEADGYAVADNRAGELAEWNYEALAANLRQQKDTGEDLKAVGWEDWEIEPLLQADWGWKPGGKNDSEDDVDNPPLGKVALRFNEFQWSTVYAAIDQEKHIMTEGVPSLEDVIVSVCTSYLTLVPPPENMEVKDE